jgi:thiol:disulfide interchange protein DsbD
MGSDWISEFIRQHGLWLGLIAVFIGGVGLNLTPCVYPMIPVTLAFFSGQGARARGRAGEALRRTVALAGCYVLGIALTYALLGFIAARTGALFGSWLQQPAVLVGIAAVVVALSCSLFGLYELRPPRALTRRFGRASSGFMGAFAMGLVVGVIAAPCIGPFVLGLLLLVSQLANPLTGFLVFFMLGLGMGLPYVLLGVTTRRIVQLPKAGEWLLWSKKVLGVVLLGLALYFLKPLLPAALLQLLVIGLLLGAGVYLGWMERSRGPGRWFVLARRTLGGVLVASAAVVGWSRLPSAGPAVSWVPYNEAALEQAQRDGQPALIDVYADWCIPCVEMDHVTFRNPRVVQALASVRTLRLDATTEVSPDGEAFLERFRVYGVPAILFFDRAGRERRELRLLGFATVEEFLDRLEQIL